MKRKERKPFGWQGKKKQEERKVEFYCQISFLYRAFLPQNRKFKQKEKYSKVLIHCDAPASPKGEP